MRYLILNTGRIIKAPMTHIDIQTFWKLKPGDRVETASGPATVLKGPTIGHSYVELKVDKPQWLNPYFYQYEIKSIIQS
jgi:hypothetical protein